MQFKLVQLTEGQVEEFIHLLTDEKCEEACIPFRAEENARRVHPNHAEFENIYRNQDDRRSFVGRLPPHCCDIIPKEDHEWLSTEYQRLWDINHSS